ncbi:hypothetical protein LNT71_004087 [Salmonella enterica]|nr:hypothetical protein [Salmonella enterica]
MAKAVMKLGEHRNAEKVIKDAERIKPARIQLNAHPDLHEQFRKVAFNNDEQMSDLITNFVIDYLRSNGVEIDNATAAMYLDKPTNWTR